MGQLNLNLPNGDVSIQHVNLTLSTIMGRLLMETITTSGNGTASSLLSDITTTRLTDAVNGYSNDTEGVFYWINRYPVTYGFFGLNIIIILVHIGIIALNSCMIAAIRRSRKAEEPCGHCLITLSVAYIWHGFMMIYTGIYGLANPQEVHECLIRFGMTHASFVFISWANCILTVDRYLQIEFPFWYKKKMHVRTIWVCNAVAAFLIILFSHTTLIFSWYRPKDNRNNVCEYFNILPALYLQIFYIITFSGFPFQIAAYSRLLFIANRHRKSLKRLVRASSAQLAANQSRKKWKPVKIVFTICAVYLVCWGPPGFFGVYITLDPAYPKITSGYSTIFAGLIMVPSLSGIICPCMYTLHNEAFPEVKLRFLQLIGWKRSRLRRLISYISERSVSGSVSEARNASVRKPGNIITSEVQSIDMNNSTSINPGFLSDNSSILTDLEQSSTLEMTDPPKLKLNREGEISGHQMTALFILGQKSNKSVICGAESSPVE